MNFQQRVYRWVQHCFGTPVANDIRTRYWRFFEEAGELCQSLGMTKEDALKLVEYTWSRPAGEPKQEMGGVMVTLAALATPTELDMATDGEEELVRCWINTEKIRAKQASKAKLGLGSSPLPGSAYIGKYVTLGVAINVNGLWIPQQTVWRITGEESDRWIVVDPQDLYIGIFGFEKVACSEPRDET